MDHVCSALLVTAIVCTGGSVQAEKQRGTDVPAGFLNLGEVREFLGPPLPAFRIIAPLPGSNLFVAAARKHEGDADKHRFFVLGETGEPDAERSVQLNTLLDAANPDGRWNIEGSERNLYTAKQAVVVNSGVSRSKTGFFGGEVYLRVFFFIRWDEKSRAVLVEKREVEVDAKELRPHQAAAVAAAVRDRFLASAELRAWLGPAQPGFIEAANLPGADVVLVVLRQSYREGGAKLGVFAYDPKKKVIAADKTAGITKALQPLLSDDTDEGAEITLQEVRSGVFVEASSDMGCAGTWARTLRVDWDGKGFVSLEKGHGCGGGFGAMEASDHAQEQNKQAGALWKAGKQTDAVKNWKEACSGPCIGPEPCDNLGYAYWSLKQYDDALKTLLIIENKADEQPTILYNLALVYRDMGRKDDAVFYFRRFLGGKKVSAAQKRIAEEELQKLGAP